MAGTFALAAGMFAETIVLGRYLGAAQYGVYSLVLAFPEVVQLLPRLPDAGGDNVDISVVFWSATMGRVQLRSLKLLWLVDIGVVATSFVVVFVTAPIVAPHLTDNPEATQLDEDLRDRAPAGRARCDRRRCPPRVRPFSPCLRDRRSPRLCAAAR